MAGGATLMSGGRRYLAAALLAILLVPSLGMLAAPHETTSVMERRTLARLPPMPRAAGQWLALPRGLDAWFGDHFAWRGPLVKAALQAEARAGLKPSASTAVIQGRGDWLLLQSGLLGATGGETRPAIAERYAAFVCDQARSAKARGETFLFAPAPSPAEIYPEALPDWVPRGSPTQPERVLQAVRACGVQPLDLRPAMVAAKGGEKLYQHHDSHWTNAGALVAFNAVVQALHQPWTIAPQALHWRPGRPFDSDLVRLSGLVGLPDELAPEPPEGAAAAPTAGRIEDLDHGIYDPAFIAPGRTPGPRVLIIGDSYAADFMPQYFARAGVTLAWIHQDECRFDPRIFQLVKPDFVVLMPISRFESCR